MQKTISRFFPRIFPAFIFISALLAMASTAMAAAGTNSNGGKIQPRVDTTDLTVSISDSPDPALRGANVTYTITVANSTAVEAQNFSMTVFISNFASLLSFSVPNGFNCAVPTVGSRDAFNCTAATVAGNSSNVFTLVLKVDSDAGLGASLYESVKISSDNDSNGGNNSAAAVTELAGGVFVSNDNGNNQSADINTAFPDNLTVFVSDGNYNPLPGVQVTFTAPASGASGTFANGTATVSVTTDANGYATAPIFTANGTAGSYLVTATVPNADQNAEFNLTNLAPLTFTVSNVNDSGAGSLRQAIEDANENPGNDTVIFDSSVFSTPQTITLTSGEIFISDNGTLAINGPGANLLTISGNNASRIFGIGDGNVTINDVKLANGSVTDERGGAIETFDGTLVLNRCAFYNNSATGGGAISASGTELIINQSTFSANQARNGFGGAIFLLAFEGSSTTSIVNSTFNGNSASRGGAIYKGIPIFGGDPLRLDLTSVTIAGNTATDTGGGVFVDNGNFYVISSIVAGNTSDDINGTITSLGYNLIQSTANTVFTGGAPQSTDITGTNPMLSPLANNGGTTETMALQPGSPAIDKGTSSIPAFGKRQQSGKNLSAIKVQNAYSPSAAIDQRGFSRPFDDPSVVNAADGSDIGAFEKSVPTAAAVSIGGRVSGEKKGILNALVTLTDRHGQTQTARTNSFGYFKFENVAVGETYVVSVSHKRYQFAPQVVSPSEEIKSLTFAAAAGGK